MSEAHSPINNFYSLNSGEIYFKGNLISHLSVHEICKLVIGRISLVVKPFKRMTVLENVMLGAFLRASSTAKARDKVLEVLGLELCRYGISAKNG